MNEELLIVEVLDTLRTLADGIELVDKESKK